MLYVFLIVILTGMVNIPVLNNIAYIPSAYALTISVIGISKIVMFARNGVSEHPFMKWLLSALIVEKLIYENRFRTEIALYPGFCINVLYVIFKTATGIYYRSAWFLSLGAYYLALVSLFSLETAMLAQFGSESTEHFRVIMTALTGAGVSCIMVGMAVFMIVRSGVLIKRNTEDGK